MKKSGIYQIFCLSTSKSYVGSSVDIVNRWSHHRSHLKNNKHGNKYLQHAWNKYGEDQFIFKILEIVTPVTKENLEAREDFWIDSMNSMSTGGGYNLQGATQGTFNLDWHIQEKERKQKKMSEKTFEHYSKLKALDGIEEAIKTNIIERTLKFKETHSISLDRKSSNKLKIYLTSKETGTVREVFILLNPYKVVTKEEFDIPVQTPLGSIFQIKPDSSEIIRIFLSFKEIRDTYPQIKIASLEGVLYGKKKSVNGMIFIPEKEYDSNILYAIMRQSDAILQIDKDKNILKRYATVKHVLKEHNLNESSLRTALCKNQPTLQYPFVYEGKLESAKFGTNYKVKLIVITGDSETEYLSVTDFVTQYPEYKRKAIKKVLYEGKKHYKGLKFKTVKYLY